MKKARVIVAITLLAVVACLVVFLPRGTSPHSSDPELVGGPRRDPAGSAITPDRIRDGIDDNSRTSQAPADELQHTQLAGELRIKGFVHVSDHNGVHCMSERGSLDFVLFHADGSKTTSTVAITNDQWEIVVPADSELSPSQLLWSSSVDSQYAEVSPERFRSYEGQGHTILATLDSRFLLTVLDAMNRQHLKDLQVLISVPVQRPYRDTCFPPSALLTAGDRVSGDSPILLPNKPGSRVGWVRAAGYAWRRFAYSRDCSNLTVLLQRGADLKVSVANVPSDCRAACVQVYALESGNVDASFEPWAVQPLDSTLQVQFEGLPPGNTLAVVVPSLNTPVAGCRLGEAQVLLPPSEFKVVAIDLASPLSTRDYGTIETTIQHAKGAMSSSAHINIQRIEITDQASIEHYPDRKLIAPDGSYTSRCSRLAAGEYVVSLVPDGPARQVTVRPGTTTTVVLDMSKRLHLTVTALDPDDHRRLPTAKLLYRRKESRTPEAWEQIEPRDSPYEFHFLSAPGQIEIAISDVARETTIREVEIVDTDVSLEIEVPLAHRCSFRLLALQNGARAQVPAKFWYSIKVTAVSPDTGKLVARRLETQQVAALDSLDSSGAVFSVNRPGRYYVEYSQVMGIRAPPPFEVVVSANGAPDQVVEVEFD